PVGGRGPRFLAVLARLDEVLSALVHREAHEAGGAGAHPPEAETGGQLRGAGGREHRDSCTSRAAEDDGGPQAEVADERGERVGLHRRLRLAGEADLRLTAVGPIPDEHLVALGGQRLRQLTDPAVVLAEAPAGRDDPRATLA